MTDLNFGAINIDTVNVYIEACCDDETTVEDKPDTESSSEESDKPKSKSK